MQWLWAQWKPKEGELLAGRFKIFSVSKRQMREVQNERILLTLLFGGKGKKLSPKITTEAPQSRSLVMPSSWVQGSQSQQVWGQPRCYSKEGVGFHLTLRIVTSLKLPIGTALTPWETWRWLPVSQ
jgi:hypothetical protein